MKLRSSKVVSKGKTSKWPFAPPRTHPIMSRGKLAEAHQEDLKVKALQGPPAKKQKKKKGGA